MHLQYMVGLRHSSAHHLSAFVPGEYYTVKYDIVVEMPGIYFVKIVGDDKTINHIIKIIKE